MVENVVLEVAVVDEADEGATHDAAGARECADEGSDAKKAPKRKTAMQSRQSSR